MTTSVLLGGEGAVSEARLFGVGDIVCYLSHSSERLNDASQLSWMSERKLS